MGERWWGTFSLKRGQAGRFRIGPMTLGISRFAHEWRVARRVGEDPFDDTVGVQVPFDGDLGDLPDVERFALADEGDEVLLQPRLADRAVITQPADPFLLPSGERATLFVGTSLWLEVGLPNPRRRLSESSILRPSDTWFGPPTEDGELCYATRTHSRLVLADLPVRPHRAVTALTIRNKADETLRIHHLRLPIPLLALFVGADGRFWTQDVTLERTEGSDFANVRIAGEVPARADRPEKIAGPREVSTGGVMTRSFQSLFSR